MLCSHCPINNSYSYLHITLFVKRFIYQVSMCCKNWINISFAWQKSRGFLREGVGKQVFSPFPINFSKTIKNRFLGIWESWHHTKWRAGRMLGFPYLETYVVKKKFRILLTSDLNQKADDANESHNYIACILFFGQLIQTALSIISTVLIFFLFFSFSICTGDTI